MNLLFSPSVQISLQKALKRHEAGDLEGARSAYETLLVREPKQFDALHLLGLVHHQLGQHTRAAELIRQAIAIYAGNPIFHANLATALTEIGDYPAALKSYDRALRIDPKNSEVQLNRAAALIDLGGVEEAQHIIREHLQRNPRHESAWVNLGSAQRRLNQAQEAVASFHRALEINGTNTETMHKLASAHLELGQHIEALAVLDILCQHDPKHLKASVLQAQALFALKQFDRSFKAAFRFDQIDTDTLSVQLMICQGAVLWDQRSALCSALSEGCRAGETISIPFHALAVQTDPQEQLQLLQRWIQRHRPEIKAAQPKPPASGKIKLAYVSGDFKQHPVAYLTAELFELHDRSRFEVIGVDINSKKEVDPMTERIMGSVDHWFSAHGLSDPEVYPRLQALGIDIAIDLAGLTDHNRINLFAHRIAPVQVNYLGFPATLGAPYIDYIIGDQTVIPQESARFYAEQVVYMPDTFQPNDRKRPIADTPANRAEVGLPAQAMVYCCFCNNHKFTPQMFDAWAAILRAVPSSVLWLLANHPFIEGRILMEMNKRQIGAERLVFGGRLAPAQYLARYRLADLFLDTYPFNAGTTASDALWAGLPVLTLCGATFASRMAASLLKAVGLPQCIAHSHEQYQAQAIEWGLNRSKLVELKQYLSTQRLTLPLFDTPRYVRHLEQAYCVMVERLRRGEKPSPLHIAPMPSDTPIPV
ncbi:MAG: hypothetical protein RIT26_2578 [Pseudomonadota bacterium]|jgi:predicted O-linked N-acetylglucosamine transferase (SPINDLY family)